MTINKKFKLRFGQLNAGISNRALATKCDISESSVRKANKGIVPGKTVLEKIALNCGVTTDWLLGFSEDEGQEGTTSIAEANSTYSARETDHLREDAIGKMGTIISFLVDTYGDLPSMMDDCIHQMKTDLRKSNPDFRQWEYEQQDKLLSRRKKREGSDSSYGPGPDESVANG